jgi:zinc-ribbon domain
MRCPSCGIEIQPGATNCPSCGTSVDTSETSSYEENVDSIPYIPYSFDPLGQVSTNSPIEVGGPSKQPLAADTRSTPEITMRPERLERAHYRGISKITGILITILVLLGVISGGGIISYAAVFHPAELNCDFTPL